MKDASYLLLMYFAKRKQAIIKLKHRRSILLLIFFKIVDKFANFIFGKIKFQSFFNLQNYI